MRSICGGPQFLAMNFDIAANRFHFRIGVMLGDEQSRCAASKIITTFIEGLARVSCLLKLIIVASPLVIHSPYSCTVSFGSWLIHILSIYALFNFVVFLLSPQPSYNGLAF